MSTTKFTAAATSIDGSGTRSPRRADYNLAVLGVQDGERSLHAIRTEPFGCETLACWDGSFASPAVADELEAMDEVRIVGSEELPDLLSQAMQSRTRLRIALDVTGLDRVTIARVFGRLWGAGQEAEVDVFYSPGVFDPIGPTLPVAFRTDTVGDVFTGDALDVGLPVALVLGLGYEPHIGVGALDQLAPDIYWAFAPKSFEPRYDQAVERANRHLTDLEGPAAWIEYPIEQPELAFRRVVEIASVAQRDRQVILVPFGPRIFTAVCCFAAGHFGSAIEVASVTVHPAHRPDSTPDGRVSAVRFTIQRSQTP